MDHPTVLTAVVTTAGVIVTAVLGFVASSQGRTNKRVAELEKKLSRAEKTNSQLWAYTRALIDSIYRLGGTPPAPPRYVAALFDLSPRDEDDADEDISAVPTPAMPTG